MDIIKNIQPEIENIVTYYDFTLYDMEFEKEGAYDYLRVYIEKKDNTPVTIEDCVELSRKINAYLETSNPIEEDHILEVSSPGIIKKLRLTKHYEREIGKVIEVRLTSKKKQEGILEGVNEEFLVIDGQEIPRKKIKFSYSTYDFGAKND